MMKGAKDKMDDWIKSREEVISKCSYFASIRPRIRKLKSLEIPPTPKLFLNEAIGNFVFGMYFSAIALCRTACEVALKYYAIEAYIKRCGSKKSIDKSIIDGVVYADLSNLQLILGYSNILTKSIKSAIRDVTKFGNIHVHGDIEKIANEYLRSSLTKKTLINYCLNLKKLDYMFSPEGIMESGMFDGYSPTLEKIEITETEAKEILKQFPKVLTSPEAMPMAKRILTNTLKLYEVIFGKLLV